MEIIMRLNSRLKLCLGGAVLVLVVWAAPARPQGSGSTRTAPPRATRPPTQEEFQQAFWKFLTKKESPYTKWKEFPGKEGFQEGKTPHGAFTKTFINKAAAESLKDFAFGSILVTENYGDDQKTLKDLTIMYRVKGTDPQHRDWYWLKYLPNGAIALTSEKEGKKPIAGKVASCIDCHAKAAGGDLVYSNDPKPEAAEPEAETEK